MKTRFFNIEHSNTEEFNLLTIKQKNKYPPVKIRDNPCKSVAKKIKMGKNLEKPGIVSWEMFF